MKNAIVIHGMLSREEYDESLPSLSHWIPWMHTKLVEAGFIVHTLEMPEPYNPNYEAWKSVIEKLPIHQNTLLIGHSAGAGFILRFLSEHPKEVQKIILVAPWLDVYHELENGFLDFTVDKGIIDRAKEISILYSTDDTPDVVESIAVLRDALPGAIYIEFSDKGHFCLEDLQTVEFPELLEIVLK